MVIPAEDIKQGTGNFQFPFDRLVAIGISGKNDRFGFVIFRIESFFKKFRSMMLHHDFPLKVEPGTETPIFMRISCITIDTAVFTTLIWIDRAHKDRKSTRL